jgi:cytochrome c oxidase assembly protein Cox11
MKLSLKKQQGMTMISMTFIAVFVGAIFFLGIAIVPIYMDHGKVTGALSSIKDKIESGDESSKSPEQISVSFFKILGMNNLDKQLTKENVSIGVLDTGATQVRVEYEVVKKIVGNVSVLVQFDDSVEINGGGK